MSESKTTRKHIAVFAFPFATHALPVLSLIQRLSAVVPDLNFSFFSTQESNESLFSKIKVDSSKIKPYNVGTGLPEDYVFKGNPHEPVDYFLKATPGNYKKAVEEAVAEKGKIGCFITDAFLWFTSEMAEEMQVPWIPVWTSGPRPLFVHVDTDNLREHMGINGPGDKTLEFLPGFSETRAKDVPDGIISGSLDGSIPKLLYNMGKKLQNAPIVCANSFEELDSIVVNTLKSRFKKFLNIGPFTLTLPPTSDQDPDSHGCIAWLDKHERSSVAYISFGTVITPPPNELAALAEALEEGGFPFLWSFRGNTEDRFAKGFLERTKSQGKTVPWAPQLKVLSHSSVGVFVTHGGWNSITESITGGVPMICRSFFGDQGLNQRTIEAVWGIGSGIEGGKFTKESTLKALNGILKSEEGKSIRAKIGVLKEQAFNAVEPEGSSTANFKDLIDFIIKS